MYSFKELKKNSKLEISAPEIRLAVLGDSSTQLLSEAVTGAAKLSGLNLKVLDTGYNQIDIQLIDKESETYLFHPNAVLIWLASEKLYEDFLDAPFAERETFAENTIKKLIHYWDLVEENCSAGILQPNFTEVNDRVLGNYSCKEPSAFTYQIKKLNYLLEEAMSKRKGIYPVDLLSLQIQIGQNLFHDPVLYYNAKMTVSLNALPLVAKAVTDVLLSLNGRIKKCLIMDLDNTLWGGVIGDDGIGGIQIGGSGTGHAYLNLQRWIRQLKEYGIILAVCSKNNEETAKEPFERIREMILKLSDISLFVANWEDKVSNIRKIQESLNIGMDSIVFIDDNPFERDAVRTMLPGITVPELPEDPALFLDLLQKEDFFNVVTFANNSADRTKEYREEFRRKQTQAEFDTMEGYLKSLNMTGSCRSFDAENCARIAELTQRSNQWNLRTVRYTEKEIEQIAENDQYITRYFTLKDRFGYYGLVAVVILKKTSETEVFLDTWLMSCRVLKRGMEEFVINCIMDTVKKNGFQTVLGQYIATGKNSMVKDIYKKFGFTEQDNGFFSIRTEGFKEQTTFVAESRNE